MRTAPNGGDSNRAGATSLCFSTYAARGVSSGSRPDGAGHPLAQRGFRETSSSSLRRSFLPAGLTALPASRHASSRLPGQPHPGNPSGAEWRSPAVETRQFAADENPPGRSVSSLIDAQFQLAARNRRAPNMAFSKGVAFAYVEPIRSPVRDSRQAWSGRSDMNGTVAAASESNWALSSAGHIGAQASVTCVGMVR